LSEVRAGAATGLEDCTPGATALGVIDEARRRRRRRRAAYAATLLVVTVAGWAVFAGGEHSPPAPRNAVRVSPRTAVAPRAVFAQAPYLGVACHIPNSVACERVGLAIWLGRPAVAVTATIGAHIFDLDMQGNGGVRRGGIGTEWAGFLKASRLFTGTLTVYSHGGWWAGNGRGLPEAQTSVRFILRYADGTIVRTTVPEVSLHAGYG
jgi:hypothetical protein